MTPGSPEITQALVDARGGSTIASQRLWALVYDQLRGIAHRQLLRERQDHTLSTTALVHEAYLKLVDQSEVSFADRSHFFGVASKAMRHILVDYARRRSAQKRGGKLSRVELQDSFSLTEEHIEELLAVDEALRKLARHSERLSRVVECRYFAGLSDKETAGVLGVSERTVQRDWLKAKGWLYRIIHDDAGDD